MAVPGISLVAGRDRLPAGAGTAALDTVRFADDYRTETLLDADDVFVGWSGYPSYPLTRLETGDWHLFLEGCLYDRPAAKRERELARVAEWVARGEDENLDGWLQTCDGDFVLVAVGKPSGDAFVLTDSFARLPLYRTSVGGADVVSRELGVLRSLTAGDPFPVDRLAVAQTLLFGYQLGDRTLFDGVERLPPATRLRLGGERSRVYRHDFGSRAYANEPTEQNARRLARQFVDACERRSRAGPVVVSLSGGLDSRAAAAGFAVAGADVRAVTFDRVDADTGTEVRVAREVADALNVPWESYRVDGSAAAENWLLDAKRGMNSLDVAFVVDFLDRLVDDYGRGVTLVTGDGGDKALPDLTPPRSFRDVDDVAGHLIADDAVLDPSDAAAAAGVDEGRLLDSVVERLRGYPEGRPEDRYVHFYVRERGINWLNEGEDRNRYFCWSVSPFYALPFFLEAMNCPAEQKARSTLYRAFLQALSPRLERIEYADFGAEPDSTRYVLKRAAYEEAGRYPRLKSSLLGLMRDGSAGDEVRRRLRTLLATRPVDDALDPEAVRRILDEGVPAAGAYDLLTVARVADTVVPSGERGT